MRALLGPPSPYAERHLDRFSRFFAQLTAERPHILQWAATSPQNCPFTREIWTPSNTWFLDRFSRFAGLTIATDRQTDQATPSVTIGRMYLMLRCSLKLNNVNSENIVKY